MRAVPALLLLLCALVLTASAMRSPNMVISQQKLSHDNLQQRWAMLRKLLSSRRRIKSIKRSLDDLMMPTLDYPGFYLDDGPAFGRD